MQCYTFLLCDAHGCNQSVRTFIAVSHRCSTRCIPMHYGQTQMSTTCAHVHCMCIASDNYDRKKHQGPGVQAENSSLRTIKMVKQ